MVVFSSAEMMCLCVRISTVYLAVFTQYRIVTGRLTGILRQLITRTHSIAEVKKNTAYIAL